MATFWAHKVKEQRHFVFQWVVTALLLRTTKKAPPTTVISTFDINQSMTTLSTQLITLWLCKVRKLCRCFNSGGRFEPTSSLPPPPLLLSSPLEIPSILTLKLGKLLNSWATVPTVLMDYYLLVHVNNFPKKVEGLILILLRVRVTQVSR